MMLYNMLGRAGAPDRLASPTAANRYQPETQRRSRPRTEPARSVTSATPSALANMT
jgi:hypothetical protein